MVGYSPWGHKEPDMSEWRSVRAQIQWGAQYCEHPDVIQEETEAQRSYGANQPQSYEFVIDEAVLRTQVLSSQSLCNFNIADASEKEYFSILSICKILLWSESHLIALQSVYL